MRIGLRFLSAFILIGRTLAWAEGKDPTPIAYLHHAVMEVQIRRSGDLAWETPKDLAKLANHDAVKTGPHSSATVQFFDETNLNIGEKSMIIVMSTTALPAGRTSALALP